MAITIRNDIRPGDLGSLIRLHGDLYWKEYGFDEVFESYVGEHMSRFVRERSEGERIWIVAVDEEVLGCIAVVRHTDEEAQLRWYLLHPRIRGRGIGKRLMAEALAFARSSGYRSIFLLTESVLKRAASIYAAAGFTLTWEKEEVNWGSGFVQQRYDMVL